MTMPNQRDLIGLWRRESIAWPDGRIDDTTAVAWLQGREFYADLRQPAGRPAFAGVNGLRQVRRDHLAWLAAQEGFAGKLALRGGSFHWHRAIDFQPPARHPDLGRLRFEGDSLIEEGSLSPYVEVWRRREAAVSPCVALVLRDRADGTSGLLLRVGRIFMYARNRPRALPRHRSLADCVMAAASLREAQDLLDCEISLGAVAGTRWMIEASSLPFREGRDLCPRSPACGAGGRIETADVTPDGAAMTRRWQVIEAQDPIGESPRPTVAAADPGDRPLDRLAEGPSR